MVHEERKEAIYLVQQGDEELREEIIQKYKPYIINTVGHLCKRFVTWSDDEASIGLIAFNRALDTYNPSGGRNFLNYVYLIIKNSLVDYYRKEQRHKHLPLEITLSEEESAVSMEVDKAKEEYHQAEESNDLVEEILELDLQLREFGISFEELENYSPKHQDTRDTLMEMAKVFSQDSSLVTAFWAKKRLPAGAFAKEKGFSLKTIERHRKFLITLILIQLNCSWIHLAAYLQGDKGKEGAI